LDAEVHIEYPQYFSPASGKDLVLRLLKSLYGLRQALKTFYEKLRQGLIDRGYTPSDVDPCLFMKNGIICVVYVDDTIFAGPDDAAIQREIKSLGMDVAGSDHNFALRDAGEPSTFLGILINKTGENEYFLTQPGLIGKVLEPTDMNDCNGVSTPVVAPLGADTHGAAFKEEWDYSSVVGMLMYLAGNSRPGIAYAVYAAGRHSHYPRNVHAKAVKRIVRISKKRPTEDYIYVPPTIIASIATLTPISPASSVLKTQKNPSL